MLRDTDSTDQDGQKLTIDLERSATLGVNILASNDTLLNEERRVIETELWG